MSFEFPGITPQLTVLDTAAAVDFYRAAFGADELLRNHTPDGQVMHCELLVYGGRLLLHDEFAQQTGVRAPVTLGGTPVVLHLYVDDVDAAFERAVNAGARALMAPTDAFWGDRYAMIEDPFGHHWSLATTRDDLSVAGLEAASDQWSVSGPDTR
jgi:PhnB protein